MRRSITQPRLITRPDSELYEIAHNDIKNRFKDKITYETLPQFIKCAIESVEIAATDTDTTGDRKLSLAMRLIRDVIDPVAEVDNNYALLEPGTLEQLISIIIAASKGQVDVNNTVRLSVKVFRCFIQIGQRFCCKNKKDV